MKTNMNRRKKSGVRMTAAALIAAVVVSAAGAVLSPAASVDAEASTVSTPTASTWGWSASVSGDTTRYVGYASITTVLQAALLRSSEPDAIYEQLMMGLWMGTYTEADILDLIIDGYTIPDETLERLYLEGWISAYLYKTGTGQSYTASDFAEVFDAEYYVANNPAIAAAVASGDLPNDEETLFYNWLLCGIDAGLNASEDFNFEYFEAHYPTLCARLGYDKLNEVVYYIMLKDSWVLQGNA